MKLHDQGLENTEKSWILFVDQVLWVSSAQIEVAPSTEDLLDSTRYTSSP